MIWKISDYQNQTGYSKQLIKIKSICMNKLFFIDAIIIFTINANLCFSQSYFINKYSLALDKAKSENKRIFVDFGAEWCNPCKMMDKQVLSDSLVKEFLMKEYICLKLDFDKDRSLVKKYSVNVFPKYLILSNKGQVIYSWTGYTSKEVFLKRFESIPMVSIEKDHWDILYKDNKNNSDFLNGYYDVLKKYKYKDKASQIADKILKKDKNWLKKRNMDLIVDNFEKKKYKIYVLKNKSEFEKSFSTDKINSLIFADYMKNNYRKDYASSNPNINAIKTEMKELFGQSSDLYSSEYFIKLLETKENHWNTYLTSLGLIMKRHNKLFTNDNYYNKLTKVLLRNLTISELNEIYEGIKNQFNLNYDFNLKYYDLKALAEYKLLMKDEANKTLQSANLLSLQNENKAFDSILHVLISLTK